MGGRWDLEQAAGEAVRFREERDWGQFHAPKNLAAGLAIEAAELQELFLWEPARPVEDVTADRERVARIAEELADVAVYVLLLAHDFRLDLSEAIRAKLRDNERRYPADQYRGRPDKAPH